MSRRGLPSQAFEYILYNKGLMGEDSYPYRAKVFPAQPRPLRRSRARHRLQQLLSVPTERHLQVPAREGHCLCQGCYQYHSGEAPRAAFPNFQGCAKKVLGCPKVCWAPQLKCSCLCAPGRERAAVHAPALLHTFWKVAPRTCWSQNAGTGFLPASHSGCTSRLGRSPSSHLTTQHLIPCLHAGSQGYPSPCALAADLDWSQHSQEMMDDPGSSLAV